MFPFLTMIAALSAGCTDEVRPSRDERRRCNRCGNHPRLVFGSAPCPACGRGGEECRDDSMRLGA